MQPSTQEAVGVGIAVVLDNETVPRRTALGTDGREMGSFQKTACRVLVGWELQSYTTCGCLGRDAPHVFLC